MDNKEPAAFKTIAELKPEIEEAIRKSTFRGNSLGIEIINALDRIEATIKPSKREYLESIISENPIRDFVFSEMYYALREAPFVSEYETNKLITHPSFSAPSLITNNLIANLENPNFHYKLIFNLGSVGSIFGPLLTKNIKLSPSIYLVTFTEDEINQNYNFSDKTDGCFNDAGRFIIEVNVAYLEIHSQGYLPIFGGPTKQKIYDLLKEVLIILKTYTIITIRGRQHANSNKFLSLKQTADKYTFHDYFHMESDSTIPIPQIEINEDFKNTNADFQSECVDLMSTIFPIYFNLKEKVRCAARWLMNSYLIGNELLQYILAITAIETLLGERKYTENVGIANLIGNRLAYAIGTSEKDRVEIISSFKDIYAIRCKIVHSGCEKLTEKELNSLWILRRYIHCYLMYEIKLHS